MGHLRIHIYRIGVGIGYIGTELWARTGDRIGVNHRLYIIRSADQYIGQRTAPARIARYSPRACTGPAYNRSGYIAQRSEAQLVPAADRYIRREPR